MNWKDEVTKRCFLDTKSKHANNNSVSSKKGSNEAQKFPGNPTEETGEEGKWSIVARRTKGLVLVSLSDK